MKYLEEKISDFDFASDHHKALIAVREYRGLVNDLIEKERELEKKLSKIQELEDKLNRRVRYNNESDHIEPCFIDEDEHDEGADYNFKYLY